MLRRPNESERQKKMPSENANRCVRTWLALLRLKSADDSAQCDAFLQEEEAERKRKADELERKRKEEIAEQERRRKVRTPSCVVCVRLCTDL